MPGAPVKANLVATPPATVNLGGAAAGAEGAGGGAQAGAAGASGPAAANANANAQASAGTTAAQPAAASGAPDVLGEHTALYFATASASLDAQSADALAGVARRLVAEPGIRVAISGYADSTGSYASNERLAAARAATVRNALIVAGVKSERIDMHKPARIVANDPPDKSRRVDVTFSPAAGG
ncbi:OmpA family protein [Paraburkholderia sp. CNPSo 3274]|nr:OmpA family protein [Paraburkholderia sp. CNPSo 3274]